MPITDHGVQETSNDGWDGREEGEERPRQRISTKRLYRSWTPGFANYTEGRPCHNDKGRHSSASSTTTMSPTSRPSMLTATGSAERSPETRCQRRPQPAIKVHGLHRTTPRRKSSTAESQVALRQSEQPAPSSRHLPRSTSMPVSALLRRRQCRRQPRRQRNLEHRQDDRQAFPYNPAV